MKLDRVVINKIKEKKLKQRERERESLFVC
jgi:hypothetical protein